MNFFEYLFCRSYWWFTHVIMEKEVPVFYSLSALSVLQTVTVMPVFDISYIGITGSCYIEDILGINPYVIIWIIIFIINCLYFRKKRYKKLIKEFNKMDKKKKR